MQNKQLYVAWGQALFSILVLWGLGNLAVGYSSKILHSNGIIYTCSIFISSAWVLLAYAGHGALSKETLRSIDTWAYGLVLIISFLMSFALFSLVTASEGALLQRSSIIASILASWFFLSRKASKSQILGMCMVFGGIYIVCADLPLENRGLIYTLVIVFAVLQAARVFIAELHKPHAEAIKMDEDPKARCRVVGYVMFIVAILFLVVSLVGALIHFQTGEIIMSGMPTLKDFTHPPSIFFGLIVGAVIVAPIRLIEFSSSHIIKTENYLALASLAPFSTLFWEWLTQPITGLSLKEFSNMDLLAGVIITAGGLVMALSKIVKIGKQKETWKKYVCYQAQNPEQVNDSREIVANTLEHFEGDTNKTAKALEISAEAINAILMDEDKVLAFKPKILKDTARHYRQKVARVDALTGLPNRSAFMAELRNASHDGNIYSVLFIDLNKFKPVNDTYGHEAGDAVLKGIAKRLQEIAPKDSVVTRLGGDEYCLLLPKITKDEAQSHVDKIKKAVAKPFKIGKNTIKVSASIGIATYPVDSQNPEELLKFADEGMYDNKESSR